MSKVQARAISRADIRPVSEVGLEKVVAGVYAWPGVGKTPLIASYGKRCLILDADYTGLTSAASFGSEAEGKRIKDYDDLEGVYKYLQEGGVKEWDWVWIDSLTLFQDGTLIDDILAEAHARNPSKQDRDVPSQREYLVSQSRIGRYVRQFMELPNIHVGFTFHVTAQETPSGSILYAPLLQGGKNNEFSTKIQGYLNVLAYLYVKDGHQMLRFKQSEDNIAKDKFGAQDPVVKDPDWRKLTGKWEARIEEIKKQNKKHKKKK